jgi:hypothetical protein
MRIYGSKLVSIAKPETTLNSKYIFCTLVFTVWLHISGSTLCPAARYISRYAPFLFETSRTNRWTCARDLWKPLVFPVLLLTSSLNWFYFGEGHKQKWFVNQLVEAIVIKVPNKRENRIVTSGS